MASFKDFCAQVGQLEGVESYLLTTGDGRLVAHTISDPDQTVTLMSMVLLAAEKIESGYNSGRLQSLTLGLSEDNGLTIFVLGKWLLGVKKEPQCNQSELNTQVKNVIHRFRTAQNP